MLDKVFLLCHFASQTTQKVAKCARLKEQDKSSNIEQQPPFGDRKKQYTASNEGGGTKPMGASYNFDKVRLGKS